MKKVVGLVMLAVYIGTVVAANYAVKRWGVVGVGFGLVAPAAVYFVGVAFTARDVVHECLGRYAVVLGILLGASLSYFVSSGKLATASAVAFLLSELADWAVYTPLRERGFLKAVFASNVVGIFVDSLVFLWIAFGSLAFYWGQVVGKSWMTALAILVILGLRTGAKKLDISFAEARA